MLEREKEQETKMERDAVKVKNPSKIRALNHELLKVETTVHDSDLAVPVGFEEEPSGICCRSTAADAGLSERA